jgi:hypothetical protein
MTTDHRPRTTTTDHRRPWSVVCGHLRKGSGTPRVFEDSLAALVAGGGPGAGGAGPPAGHLPVPADVLPGGHALRRRDGPRGPERGLRPVLLLADVGVHRQRAGGRRPDAGLRGGRRRAAGGRGPLRRPRGHPGRHRHRQRAVHPGGLPHLARPGAGGGGGAGNSGGTDGERPVLLPANPLAPGGGAGGPAAGRTRAGAVAPVPAGATAGPGDSAGAGAGAGSGAGPSLALPGPDGPGGGGTGGTGAAGAGPHPPRRQIHRRDAESAEG